MRLSLVLLAAFAMIGCGAGSGPRAHRVVGSAFFPPSISMLSPTTVPVNSPSFTITVVGNNFGPGAVLYWNGIALNNTILINSQELMVQIPQLDLQTAGLIQVYVRTNGQNSNTLDFQVAIQ